MTRLFADEDFDHRVVLRLRALGHDVVTVMDVQRRGLSDVEQLDYASGSGRILLTFNRADFHALHRQGATHAGIVTCTRDPDIEGLAHRIHAALSNHVVMAGILVRVVGPRPGRAPFAPAHPGAFRAWGPAGGARCPSVALSQ